MTGGQLDLFARAVELPEPTSRGWVVVCGGLAHRTGPCWVRVYPQRGVGPGRLDAAVMHVHGWGWTWDSSEATCGTEHDAQAIAEQLDAEPDDAMGRYAVWHDEDPQRSRLWLLVSPQCSSEALCEADGRLSWVRRPGGPTYTAGVPEGRATGWPTEAAARAAAGKRDALTLPADSIGWGDHVTPSTAPEALTLEV